MYIIIDGWNNSGSPNGTNEVDTEDDAIKIVSDLVSLGYIDATYILHPGVPVQYVMRQDGTITVNREAYLCDLRAAKKAEVTALRYTLETGGADINGVPVDTSRESQSLITGAAFAASLDAAYTVRWKGADGTFREFDATTITALASAVRAHVQACFDAEAAHHATLDALDDAASIAGYDYRADHADAPWPVAVPSEAV